MFEIIGKHNIATVYATTVDQESYAQVLRMCNTPLLMGSKIRMMPDMHASEGCTVGTSLTYETQVNPSFVGGDIGCGMEVARLREKEIDLNRLDEVIREFIPSGAVIHPVAVKEVRQIPIKSLKCYDFIKYDIVLRSFGTLGGGNHFIELDRDSKGNLYLVIHSGSRRLGKDVAGYHRAHAFFQTHGISKEEVAKKKLRVCDIRSAVRSDDCFLSGERLNDYLSDMEIAMAYAKLSRKWMMKTIVEKASLTIEEDFCTVHNYIDAGNKILRKGAISAMAGERMLIPINMRDGSLLCVGKGNPEWNYTAPHGAGRVLKRSEAKELISLEDYRTAMQGVFSTSINENTIDESPLAYRAIEDILPVIEPTASVVEVLKPVYNFKASKRVVDDETADDND